MKRLLALILCTLVFATNGRAATDVIISEFMANNAHTLADEDGDFSDWIEIYNPSVAPVNLAGYCLTDDPAVLTKWAFPGVTLPPGGFLLVFASGKNRTDTSTPPYTNLHANFQLDGNGEFLALVKPDGVTLAYVFNPTYPNQKEDVSFGTGQQLVTTSLLTTSAPSILVPTSAGQLPPGWNQLAFMPDSAWTNGVVPPAIGFDTNQAGGLPANAARSGTAVQSTGYNGDTYPAILAINGSTSDFTHTASTDSSAFWQVTLTNEMAIYEVVLFNRGGGCCQWRLRDITVEILSTNLSGTVTNWVSPLLNPENVLGSPAYLSNNLVTITGGPIVGRTVVVRRKADPDNSGAGTGTAADDQNVLSLGEVIVSASLGSGLRPYFSTDIQSLVYNRNASAFVRLPFFSLDRPDRLTLSVRYDDGFVAYLNGTEIARRNAPATLAFDSSATVNRALTNVTVVEGIDVSADIPSLLPGANVLAVQVLNFGASNGDLLLQPELVATKLITTTNVFLVEPTPGTINNTDSYGDEVADTAFSVDRGFYDAPFAVEITSPTPGAVIYYSFNADEPGPDKGLLYTNAITITNTTVLRARAFKAGWKATDVDTATYIFLGDVVRQAPTGAAPPYFPASWGRNRVNYGMDPTVIAKYTPAQWREALTQIPTISIVTEMKNLFDPTTGIYANADGHGEDWERASSIELLDPTNAVPGRFQENCGLRIRGGYSRNTDFVKHSLRVFFRSGYGVAKLHYPMFEDEGADEFDTFDLRTSQNYAWSRETSASTGQNDTMVREVFCRETLGKMGQPYRRSRYYHLYLNGQYWGLYETDERPEASFGATYLGGNKDDYDVVKCGNHVANFVTEVTDGDFGTWTNLWNMGLSMLTNSANSNYFRILGRNADGTRNPALPVMVDADNLIDYMMGIFYTGDGDATLSAFLGNVQPNNWFGMKNRNNPEQGFIFVNSDCEHTLGAPSWQADRTGPFKDIAGSNVRNFTYSNPQYLHEELMLNAEYRLRFADHVQKHFFNGGVLTPEAGTNRFLRKTVQITKAIWAYEARWGDANSSAVRYSATDWTNRINNILTTWFPSRTATVLGQLKLDQLYPNLTAPNFSQYGGEVTNGFPLTLSQTNGAGVIYFTLDGTDPRLVGGAINSAASAYTNTVVISDSLRVKSRVFSGGNWSALTEADFAVPGTLPLRITEIMFHPAPVTAAEIAAGFTNVEDFEYIELRNVGSRAISLTGVGFINGITFFFNSGTLGAGERLLLVKNVEAFNFRYGPAANIGGTFQGNLSNGGERLRLIDALSHVILDFSYADGWVPVADGFGFSLTIVDDTAPAATWDSQASWRASSSLGGSPGTTNPPSILFPFVVVNEVLSRPAPGGKVSVELANLSSSPAEVGGWWLSDDYRTPKKFRLPANTSIPVGGFVVFTEDDFNAPAQGTNAFTFSAGGDEVRLFSADAGGELTGYYQGWDFGPADEGVSFGRHVTSTSADHLVAQASVTLGAANPGPRISPVVITEIMYRPPDFGPLDNSLDEFVEVFNRTATNVHLFDPFTGTNTWQMRGGVDFFFPTNISLAAGERLLLVNFDPVADSGALARFQVLYGVSGGVRILGPYSGKLDNSGEDVELKRPTLLPTGFFANVQVEKVSYHDSAPWPSGADGYGLSLQRRDPAAYGNDPANWVAVRPSAAAAASISGTPPTIVTQPASGVLGVGWTASLTVGATGSEPLLYQWRMNGTNLPGATNAALDLTPVTMATAGQYEVMVHNDAGSTSSVPATIITRMPPQITLHPQSVSVRVPPDSTAAPTTNATFTGAATSASPLTYQWRFNGQPIPGATTTTLTVANVKFSDWGQYTLAATDEIGTSVSDPAWLYPLVRPGFFTHPASQIAGVGLPVTFSAMATGWPPPFTFRLRRNSTGLTTNVVNDTNISFTLPEVQRTNAGTYDIVVANLAGSGTVSSKAYLTVVAPPANQAPAAGSNVTLRAVVSSPTPPSGFANFTNSFWWVFEGTNTLLTGTNASTASLTLFTNDLVIPNITEAQAGTYTFVISNVFTGPASFTAAVVIGDTNAPTLTCPANLVVNTDPGQCVANPAYAPVATDNVGVDGTACLPAGPYAPGVTAITCWAWDASGNSNSCTFTITVVDGESPVLTGCPAPQTVTTSGTEAMPDWRGLVTATDNCGTPVVSQTPAVGASLSVGTNLVTITATDGAGRTANCQTAFIVQALVTDIRLTIELQGTNALISWPESPVTWALEEATRLTAPPDWQPSSATPNPGGGRWQAVVPVTDGTNKFFRLTRP